MLCQRNISFAVSDIFFFSFFYLIYVTEFYFILISRLQEEILRIWSIFFGKTQEEKH